MAKKSKKTPYQAQKLKDSKTPRIKYPVKDEKVPRGINKALPCDTMKISWHMGIVDLEGSWPWPVDDKKTIWGRIFPKVKSFETMTWAEIMKEGQSHSVAVSEIISSASKRLEEINQDDIDALFSLRISARERLWGIRDQHMFKILWWDPNHEVCPSKKKHT